MRVARGMAVTVTAKAREALADARRRRLAATFREAFGPLSEREVRIVREALRHGYQRGYGRKRRQESQPETKQERCPDCQKKLMPQQQVSGLHWCNPNQVGA
jgi:hypothetical protein